MDVELLYFDDCPSWQSALENLRIALAEENLDFQIRLKKIESVEEAERERFLGSPSIRIGNSDLWPEEREAYSLACRVYQTPQGYKGWPTVEMIREKLANIKSKKAGEV
jgi:hypothetical protein